MKLSRVLLISLGTLAVLVLIALGVALSSSFQTWAARRALAAQPDLHASLGGVSAGFQRIELRDFHSETGGAVLTLPALEIDLPLLSAGLSKTVAVRRLIAKGWTLDLTRATKVAAALAPILERSLAGAPALPPREFSLLSSAYAAGPAAAPVFRGIFAGLLLPVDLAVDGVELDGEVILPPLPGEGPARVRVTVRGGGLAATREGTFSVDLAGAKSNGDAFTVHGTLAATMDTPRTFSRFSAKIAAEASGTKIPAGVKLNADASVARQSAGESYSLLLSGTDKQLAAIKAELAAASLRVTGTWKLDLADRDLTPFSIGSEWPVFTAAGEGSFETTTALESVHASGHLVASADQLGRVRAELAAIGATHLAADFDVLQHGNALRVEKFDATLAGAAPVLDIHALQSFEFDLRTAALQVADPARDLVGLSLTGLPVAWARPFFGELMVTGGDLRGEFVASARDGGLTLRPKSPLVVTGVSVTRAGMPLLREVDLTVGISADYTPQGWQFQIADLAVRHAGAILVSLEAKAGQLAGADQSIKLAGHWTANLAALMSQPIVTSQVQVTAGNAQGDFTGSLDGAKSFETKLNLANLAVASGEKLPAVSIQLRADVAPDGKISFKAPLGFDSAGRKSDLLVAGTLVPGAATSTIDARVTGDQVYVEDLTLLTVLIPTAPAAPADAKPAAPPDVVAFWSAVNGQLSLALKKVVYGGSFIVTDLNGTLRLDPGALKLEGVRAMFGPESDLKLAGGVKFDAKAGDRYALEANLAVNNFDTAPAFRALDPTKLPTIESRVTLTSHLTGTGENLNQAAERARGEVQVSGKSGVFRAFSADVSDKIQKTSTVAAIGGFLGGLTGKKEYSDYAATVQTFSDIAKALAEIPFDQLSVTATRGDDLNLVLKDFTLISPEIRLTGGGEIKHVDKTPLLLQPLNLQLNLGARGKLGELLKRRNLLEAKQDNLGYAAFIAPIKVGGTLAKTDTSELRKTLLNSALEKSGLIDSLLGK